MEDWLFFRARVKPGHERQQKNDKCAERDPRAGDVDGNGRRLILVYPNGFGRLAGQLEGAPDFPAVHVLADGPGDFLVELFAGEHARRMHVVRDGSLFADANLPREFTEDEIRVGITRLEVFIDFAKIICGCGTTKFRGWQRLADTNIVPMSVVFTEV